MPLNINDKPISEIIVYCNSLEAIRENKGYATAKISFEDSFIYLILDKDDKGFYWRPPAIWQQQNGHMDAVETLGGPLLQYALEMAQKALDRIKKSFPGSLAGSTFKCSGGKAELVPPSA